MQLGLRARFGSPFLRLGALKAFMDGTLGSQTALLLDGTGVRITSREELEELIRVGAQARFPVAVHAIGDRANRDALDAFEATQDVWRPLGLRHRIEHAQCLAPEDVPRFAQLGDRGVGAVRARDVGPRAHRALLAGPRGPRVPVPLALGERRRRRERLGRAGRGARSARGHPLGPRVARRRRR